VIPTINPVTIEENQVCAHAFRFTAVLLKLQATHIHPNSHEEMFAIHWPISSLLAQLLLI